MQILDGRLLLSATDLVNFLGCRHATYLDLRDLIAPAELPQRDATTALIFEKGIEHEKRYLASLKAQGFTVVDISPNGFDLPDGSAFTREVMQAGAEIIYQAGFLSPPWLGYADFLKRVAEASWLGPWSYEPVDTKLGQRAKPDHAIQLASYSSLIGAVQGRQPSLMHVQLGSNQRVSLRVSDFAHYHSIAQRRLKTFANRPREISTGEPCAHCPTCRWKLRCEAEWAAADHLTLVANITRNQIRRLWEAGISTVRSLAALPVGLGVHGIQPDTFDRLRHQATLQIAKRDTDKNYVETLPAAAGKGFARLPHPDAGDIFFDMEGYPFFDDGGGLEYLFGFVTIDDGDPQSTAFWAHDRQTEKRAFESAMDFIVGRLEAHPDARVYHYANYEETALKRLAMVHGTREAQVDDLLRRRKLVDLYKVVRESVRISEPGYSLKNLEVFYGGERAGGVATALDSMVVYDRWQQTGDIALLEQIRAYNEADCRSLLGCRDWLLSLRTPETPWFGDDDPDTESTAVDPAREAKRKEAEERSAALVAGLLDGVPEADRSWRELAGQLVDFHKREAKPEWWARFARQDMTKGELIDDAECIGGLRTDPDRPPSLDKRSLIYSFRFPAQDFKLRPGDQPDIAETLEPAGEIVRLDEDALEISVRRGQKRGPLPAEFSLIPSGPIGDKVLRAAIDRYVGSVIDGQEDRYAAVTGILRRDYPRFGAQSASATTLMRLPERSTPSAGWITAIC